jgi:hypothetical protein
MLHSLERRCVSAPSFEVRVGSFFERERLSQGGLALAFGAVLIVTMGCRTAPCPDGTVRDGDVCRRVPADAGSPQEVSEKVSPARAAAAGSGNAGRAGNGNGNAAKTGAAKAAGASGGAGSDSERAAAEETAGGAGGSGAAKSESGGGGAKSQSPDAPAKAGAGSAGKAASQTGSGGKAAAEQGGAGGAGRAGAEDAAGTGEGGSTGSAGETAGPEAGSGGEGAPGEESGGAGGEPGGSTSFPDPQWTCLQVDQSCVCVHAGSSAGDLCEAPRPTCCYLLPGSAGNCVCAPEGTQDCVTTGGNAAGMRVGQCPPPR